MAQPFVPVAAVPLKGPQLNLLTSSVAPTADGDNFQIGDDVLALLPDELKIELEASKGAAWTRGFAYQPELATAAVVRSPTDNTTVLNPPIQTSATIVQVVPYLILTQYRVSSFGFPEIDFKGLAKRQNDIAAPQAIEREFCDGALAIANAWPNNYLSKAANVTDVTPVPGTPVSVTEGLGLLQDALRFGLGGQGMIHVIPRAAPSLLNVRRVGKFMLDEFDNIVIPGVGFTGNAPGGAVAATGTTWMYATDLVMTRIEPDVRVFPDTMAEALDRGRNNQPNTFTFTAERYGCAYFDGRRQFGVLVNTPV